MNVCVLPVEDLVSLRGHPVYKNVHDIVHILYIVWATVCVYKLFRSVYEYECITSCSTWGTSCV